MGPHPGGGRHGTVRGKPGGRGGDAGRKRRADYQHASIVGLVPLQCAFVAAKAGVVNLTRAMRAGAGPGRHPGQRDRSGLDVTEGTGRKLFYGDDGLFREAAQRMLDHVAPAGPPRWTKSRSRRCSWLTRKHLHDGAHPYGGWRLDSGLCTRFLTAQKELRFLRERPKLVRFRRLIGAFPLRLTGLVAAPHTPFDADGGYRSAVVGRQATANGIRRSWRIHRRHDRRKPVAHGARADAPY